MTRNRLASGLAAICLVGAIACWTNSGTAAPAVHTGPAVHGDSAAPAPAQTGCGTGPARRAWAQEVSAAGKVTWQVRLPTDPASQGISLRPLVIGGTAIFAEENALYALRLSDGHQLWKRAFPRIGNGPVASLSAMVYGLWQYRGSVIVLIGQVSPDSRLFSLNAATGAVKWELPLGKQGETGSLTLTGDGGLAMIYGYATLTVVDLATGRIRWGRTAGNSLGPLAAGGVVIAPAGGYPSGRLLGFSSRTGKLLWTRTGMPSEPEPRLASGLLLMSSTNLVTALSPATGRTLWTVTTIKPIYYVTSGPSGIAVSTRDPDLLYLIDPKTGRVRWQASYLGGHTRLDTGTDLLYEGGVSSSSQFSLVDVRATNGSRRWAAPAPATYSGLVLRFGAYAVVIGGSATQADDPGVLAAFRLTTGKPAWTVKVPTLIQVPMTVAGADLLVQPTDGSYGCFVSAAVGSGAAS